MASSATAVSITVRERTPSRGIPAARSPKSGPIETRPRLGLRPTTPQQDAGMRIEPPRSLPSARPTRPAETAAALPPDDPPGERADRGHPVGREVVLDPVDPPAGRVGEPDLAHEAEH